MKEETFLKVLNNFIGHKIGLYTNNESFVEGYLIDVKNDHFVIQVDLFVFYFSINNVYAISKNAKHSKPKEKGAPYVDKVFLNDVMNDFKYRWVTINSSGSQIFTGLLTRNTDDYVLLLNKDEQYFIQKSTISSIAEGVVEQESDLMKPIEIPTSPESELMENNKNVSELTPTSEEIDSTIEKEAPQDISSQKNPEVEGDVEQRLDQKKTMNMPTSPKIQLMGNNNSVPNLTFTSEAIDRTIGKKEPQAISSRKNPKVEGVVEQEFGRKKSIEMSTSSENELTKNMQNVIKLISASGIIDRTIEKKEPQELISQKGSEVDKAINFIDMSQNVISANNWTSSLKSENGHQNPELKINTNKKVRSINSPITLKNHDQAACTPESTNTNKVESNLTKRQHPKEHQQLFGVEHLALLFILLIIILSTQFTYSTF